MSHKMFALFGILSLLLTTFAISNSNVQASRHSVDPIVTIAIDQTSLSCTITHVITSDTTKALLSKIQTHCPQGTTIGLAHIPLSLARIRHERYVLSLPTNASALQQAQWHSQILELVKAKQNRFNAASLHTAKPYSSCGYNEFIYTSQYVVNTFVGFQVNYHVSLNCASITLTQEEVIGHTPVNSGLYWIDNYYYGYDLRCFLKDDFIGSRTLKLYPASAVPWEASQPLGYDNVWELSGGDACSGSGAGFWYPSVTISY